MNVIVPYAKLNKWIPLCLKAEGVEARYVQMEDDEHYSRLLGELWAKGETFIFLEHDVLPWPGALSQLWNCPEPYCAFPYQLSGCIGLAMGCNKFSAKLISSHAFVKPCTWDVLDGKVKHSLPYPHMHFPPVLHLNQERLG